MKYTEMKDKLYHAAGMMKEVVGHSILGIGLAGIVGCAVDSGVRTSIDRDSGETRRVSGDSYVPYYSAVNISEAVGGLVDVTGALESSGLCDLAHVDEFKNTERKRTETLLACEQKIDEGKYETKWRINLGNIIDVQVHERYQRWFSKPVDWVTDDEVVIQTATAEVNRYKMDDKLAGSVLKVLALYAAENREHGLGSDVDAYVAENYTPLRPLNKLEKRQVKEYLARKNEEHKAKYASASFSGSKNSAETDGTGILYRTADGKIIKGKWFALLDR